MNTPLDFQARITSISKILSIGEATTAATECVKLIEQALRQVVSQSLDQVDERTRRVIDEAVKKRVRGAGGIDKLTMGQMIYTLRDAGFWDEWARITGKSLGSLHVIDLEKLTQLRNKVMHDGAEATRTEAEFLLHGVKMILEIFGLMTFATDETPTSEEEQTMGTPNNTPQGGNQSGAINISGVSDSRIAFNNSPGGSHQGDIVAGDKIIRETTETTTTTITYGFKHDTDKIAFLDQIEALRATLRDIKNAVEALDDVDQDEKDEVAADVMQQVNELNTVKKEAEATPAGKEAPKEKADLMGKYLDKTTTLMEKLKKMGEATAAASEKIIPAVIKALPLLASVRRLFGLP